MPTTFYRQTMQMHKKSEENLALARSAEGITVSENVICTSSLFIVYGIYETETQDITASSDSARLDFTFKVVPFSIDTLLHSVLPLLVTVLERGFWKVLQEILRFCLNLFR
ncbi:uncharacterized protein LOC118187109 [Stegodyphus dumicola]|uniref:uncharacterized protein LOC118187109 n=1 Tax=Stegodyphus dumicola TaxID=202533 RepID=UPI0015B28292|nr:uncharacterized protein LOC118187109 [Stegodyphus dumicola]